MANLLVNKYAKAKTGLDFARNVFNFKKGHKTNFLTGRIVPSIDPIEVIPGDSFNLSFAAVVRSAPLVAPVLDDIYIDVLAFWVPNRLVMTEFAQFLGENNTKAWTLKEDVDLPTISQIDYPTITSGGSSYVVSQGYFADHYLAPHMGIRLQDYTSSGTRYGRSYDFGDIEDVPLYGNGIVTLKARGYDLIYNEWWRDENIIDPVLFSKESGPDNGLDMGLYTKGYGIQRKAARLSDFWNKMLPAPQRGDAVSIDLLGFAPVVTQPTRHKSDYDLTWNFKGANTQYISTDYMDFLGIAGSDAQGELNIPEGVTVGMGDFTSAGGEEPDDTVGYERIVPSNLYADLSNVSAYKLEGTILS